MELQSLQIEVDDEEGEAPDRTSAEDPQEEEEEA